MNIREIRTEILIIGGGAAGMAAAFSLSTAGIKVLVVDRRTQLGGVLPQCIHEGFGISYYGSRLSGPEYCAFQAKRLLNTSAGIMLNTEIIEIHPNRKALASNRDGFFEVCFDQCILASGCREKSIHSLPIAGTRPSNILTAGETQEFINIFHKDIEDNIIILGSGDIGQIMARRYSLLGKHVVAMIEQRSVLGGIKRNREECIRAFNIPVILNSTITEIHGYPELTGVTVSHLDNGQSEFIPCNVLVSAIGLEPDTSLAESLKQAGHYPDWLHLCGNSDYVHEIVDSVTAEAEGLAAKLKKAY